MRKYHVISCILFAVLLSLNMAATVSALDMDLTRQAKEFFQNGDYSKALPLFMRAAELGDAEAECYVGVLYLNGLGEVRDHAKALQWFELASNNGYADAQTYLGYMYHYQIGVTRDFTKAHDLYSKASAQGQPVATYLLGRLYTNGNGVSKNEDLGRQYSTEAVDNHLIQIVTRDAEHGLNSAQFVLASLYLLGIGVPQDNAKSIQWYTKAAGKGNAAAQHNLAIV